MGWFLVSNRERERFLVLNFLKLGMQFVISFFLGVEYVS